MYGITDYVRDTLFISCGCGGADGGGSDSNKSNWITLFRSFERLFVRLANNNRSPADDNGFRSVRLIIFKIFLITDRPNGIAYLEDKSYTIF